MTEISNKTSHYQFTIVVPVYNEEDNILNLEKQLSSFIPCALCSTCVLFVNDGSTDKSLPLLVEVCERNKDFYYIGFEKNKGLSAAMKAGIDYTFSPYVGYMDADMQTACEDFNLLLKDIDRYEMVMGIRVNRNDSFSKKIQSKIANGFRRMMTNDGVADTGCPLKILHSDCAKRIPFFNGMHRFLPALIQLQGAKVLQVPVRHFPRQAGTSKYNLWNRLMGPFMDCFAYRWMRKRYINYRVAQSNL
ncbi:MAG: glycosyltransferase family 2 protein [Dysgonamonadaceae bacterium]|nr:glycosyltransferase family 2 protein [Dysgonamonadaceae bacterium]